MRGYGFPLNFDKTVMRIILPFFIALLACFSLNAQLIVAKISPNVLASFGFEYSTPTHTGAFTVGEVLVQTISGNYSLISEGFHQDSVVTTGIHEELAEDQSIKIYPNPTVDQLTFEITQNTTREVNVDLVDMLGRVLNTQSMNSTHAALVFDLSQLADSYYFLRARTPSGKSIGTYKVQKIN